MTSRQRILNALNHKISDRVPIHDVPWGSTVTRWKKEGMPDMADPADYFGYEIAHFGWDSTPRFPVKTVEQNDEYIVQTTPQGGKRRNHLDYSTTPEIIGWPISKKEDWPEIKKRLKPDFTRVDWCSGLSLNKTAYEAGKFTTVYGACGYDALQTYMNSEQLLMAMAEDPDWIKEMIMTLAELTIVMCDLMIRNGFKFDGAFMYNDMGYRNALLFSPDTYKKTHYEADALLYGYYHSKGMKTILHSCGNVKELIPIMIETGLDCLQPLEVKAGMDVIELKEKFGDKISFMGGIDARLMSDPDPAKIEEEIKTKLTAAKKNGGYIYHSDHSIPKDVSFEQYKRVMELVKQYGVYEDYKEEPEVSIPADTAAPAPETKPAAPAVKKPGFSLFGKRGPAAPRPHRPTPPPKPAPAPKPAGEKKSPFSGFFGKKK